MIWKLGADNFLEMAKTQIFALLDRSEGMILIQKTAKKTAFPAEE